MTIVYKHKVPLENLICGFTAHILNQIWGSVQHQGTTVEASVCIMGDALLHPTTWFSTRHLNICLIVRPALKETSILLVSYVGARGVAYYTYLPPQGKMFPQKIGNEMILFPGIVAYCQGIIYKYFFWNIWWFFVCLYVVCSMMISRREREKKLLLLVFCTNTTSPRGHS